MTSSDNWGLLQGATPHCPWCDGKGCPTCDHLGVSGPDDHQTKVEAVYRHAFRDVPGVRVTSRLGRHRTLWSHETYGDHVEVEVRVGTWKATSRIGFEHLEWDPTDPACRADVIRTRYENETRRAAA